MNLTRDRIRSIGWAVVLTVCAALCAALFLRVNAVKSEVHKTERQIVSLKRQILFLETEFQTRSNQHQLKALNDVEFGYKAPRAEQYIEGERQLAALGKARGPGAPAPIRVASTVQTTQSGSAPFMAMLPPVRGDGDAARPSHPNSGKARSAAHGSEGQDSIADVIHAADLGERLARIEISQAVGE